MIPARPLAVHCCRRLIWPWAPGRTPLGVAPRIGAPESGQPHRMSVPVVPHVARWRASGLRRTRRAWPPGLGPRCRKLCSLRWLGRSRTGRQRSSRPGRAAGAMARRNPAPVIVAAILIPAAGPVAVRGVEVIHSRAGPAIRPGRKRRRAVTRSQIARSGRADSPAGPDYTGSPRASGVATWVGRTRFTAPVARRTQLSPTPAERVGVRLVAWRPVTPAAGLGRTRPSGLLTAPGGPATPLLGVRFLGPLDACPRGQVPLQIGPRRNWPGRWLVATTVGLVTGALGRPDTALLAARNQVCAFARPPAAANLSCLPARGILVRCSQRFRPDTLSAELAQPVLGVFLVVAPVIRCLAIIPPPAHRYLHDQHPRGRAHGSPPRGCARTPPLSVKGPMRAGAPQPACAMWPRALAGGCVPR